jgi:hypothetical protein
MTSLAQEEPSAHAPCIRITLGMLAISIPFGFASAQLASVGKSYLRCDSRPCRKRHHFGRAHRVWPAAREPTDEAPGYDVGQL